MNSKFSIEQEIQDFFHQFTLRILREANADPNSPKAVKMAMLDHFESIYPHFSMTDVFKRCNGKEHHDLMVEEYKKNFTLLLEGKVP